MRIFESNTSLGQKQLILQILTIFFLFLISKPTLAADEIIKSEIKNDSQFLNLQLTPTEKTWLKKKHTIRVAVKSGWMPIEFKLESDKHRGLSIDYLSQIGSLFQIDFSVVDYTENIDKEQADIISAVNGSGLKNPNYHILNKPFLSFPFAIYINKDIHKYRRFNTLDDLDGLRVAVFKNGVLTQKIRENYPNIKLVFVDIADEAFDDLKSGIIDAYVGNEMIVDYHITAHRLKFVEKTGLTPFASMISMAVSNDEPELASIMQKGILAIGKNNKDLLDNWRISDSKYDRILSAIFGGIFIIFLFILLRFYRLKQNIKKQNAETQQQIWNQANFDHLTNLPNRHLLQNRLEQAKERADRSQLPIGVLFIDLDNFKKVNDQSGHSVGDKLLIEVAKRISVCIRSGDTTARFGGDEFIVVMSDLKEIFSLENSCQKILSEIEKPFSINGDLFYISASIGVTIYPDDSHNLEELLSYADQAMYEAKKLGRNRFQFFTDSIQVASHKRLSITNDMRKALKEQQFVLYYQPIICLKNSKILKAEALIRWMHPIKGIISPLDFIPLAEESGLINELGKWVFNQSLKDLLLIRENLGSDFQLSINVSPHQFNNPEDLLMWVEKMKEVGVSGNCITVEITEGVLLDPSNQVINTISALRETGMEFSIDDFGTGYSALAYLKRFDIDYVKIDKSFIQNLETNNYDAVLCESIINMAHKLGIKVIAEGIETDIQRSLLIDFSCDYGQGYLFARPQPLVEFLNMQILNSTED
ncbi:MAG: EAL domain-containing protein [Bacteroidia bacterium]|nr:EAL domain-containing protein [Methylotenera sp.]